MTYSRAVISWSPHRLRCTQDYATHCQSVSATPQAASDCRPTWLGVLSLRPEVHIHDFEQKDSFRHCLRPKGISDGTVITCLFLCLKPVFGKGCLLCPVCIFFVHRPKFELLALRTSNVAVLGEVLWTSVTVIIKRYHYCRSMTCVSSNHSCHSSSISTNSL